MFAKSSKKTNDTASVADGAARGAADAAGSAAPTPTGAYKTTISTGSTLNGELNVDTDLHVDGRIKGRLRVGKRFVIGSEGRVTSEGIECSVAEISGLLEGPITVYEILTIHAGGHIKGDISVRDVVIEKGGRLDGRCQYLPADQHAPGNPPRRDNPAQAQAAAHSPAPGNKGAGK